MKTPHILLVTLALATSGLALAQQSAPAVERPSMRQHMEDRLKAADTDKDGLISKAEAEKGMPRLHAHFERIDTNKDGKLSSDEFKAMGKKMRHGHRGHRDHRGYHGHRKHGGHGLFAGADANRDRTLTRDELVQHQQKALQHFNTADTNKDGKLVKDEMKAMRDKMRTQRTNAPGNAPSATPASK